MKRRLPALALLLLLLAGCSGFYTNEYTVVHDHESPFAVKQETEAPEEDEPVLTAGEYYVLRSLVRDCLSKGTEEWEIRVSDNYLHRNGSLEDDLKDIAVYVKDEYPVGAYAVDYFTYELQYTPEPGVAFHAVYRRSASEIAAIVRVLHNDRAYRKIFTAVREFGTALTLQISGYTETDFQAVIDAYFRANPDINAFRPEISAQIYPDSGSVRIAELHFTYPGLTRDELIAGQEDTVSTLDYIRNNLHTGGTDVEYLNSVLALLPGGAGMTYSETACVNDFLCRKTVGSEAASIVFAKFCAERGLEYYIVDGAKDGAPYCWVMVCLDGSWYHVDITRSLMKRDRGVTLCTDSEMLPLEWDTSRYPSCGFYTGSSVGRTDTAGTDLGQ